MLGDRVIYTRAAGDEYAAIIVGARTTTVQLAVFMACSPTGGPNNAFESKTWYSPWLPFDPHGAQNTWRWRPDGSR